MENEINWGDFEKVDMRVGTIIEVEVFEKVRVPAFKITVDFGDLGTRKSSAQLTKLYTAENLLGQQVICVINFPPKQIATLMSECLVMGAMGEGNEVTILQPERKTINGLRIG